MAQDLDAADFENPNPSIHDLFTYYNEIYFEGKLGPCTLQWSSKRMTLCAGVCQYSTYGGCEIRLSEPLLKYRPVSDLKNTLLHEMIHAYLFLTKGNKDHDDHGACFQHMMMMINDFSLVDEERPEDGYEVTIYHNFTDEVDHYRTHHWRCINCSDLIKRAMNRTPSVSDCLTRSEDCSHPRCHWHMHKKKCGGSYEKIREPAGYVDKRKKWSTLASAESRVLNSESGDVGDAHLTATGQQRKVSSNGGPSKKGTKEPPGQVPTVNLDNYFTSVQKDEGKIVSTQAEAADKDHFSVKPTEGKSLSTVENNGKRKFLMLNGSSQKENTTEEGKGGNLGSQCSSARKEGEGSVPSKVFSTQMEESGVKAADQDVGRRLRSRRASPPPRQAKDTVKAPRNNGAEKDALGICGDSQSRKKYKTVNELLKKQAEKEPILIMAWANWVSYESDEDNEEPLINKRTERRKQEWNSELLKKGKTILDPSGGTVPLAAAEELQSVSSLSMEGCCKDSQEPKKAQNGHANQVVVIEDSDEDIPEKVRVTESKHLFIELSDDEKFLQATGKNSNCAKGQTLKAHNFVPEQALLDLKELEKKDLSHNSSTSTTRRGATETVERKYSSSLRDMEHGGDENTTKADIMICPICNLIFRENERNTVVNKHIDDCLAQRA